MKFHTIQNPPLLKGETFTEPSLTRESDYVSIEQIFAKFGMDRNMIPVQYRPISQLSPEERDILDNATPFDELEEEDIVIQQAFIDDTLSSVKQTAVEKEPTQPRAEDEPEKPATEPENASN